MGEFLDKVIRLAGTEHVSGYTRQSSTGKSVHVKAYTRSPGSMSNKDLAKEALAFMHKQDTYQGISMADKNRHNQIMAEVEKRRKAKEFPSSLYTAANGEDSTIMNPSTAPNPDARAQMEKKSDLQLQTLANDGGVRKADRQHAADELKRRGKPLTQTQKKHSDDALRSARVKAKYAARDYGYGSPQAMKAQHEYEKMITENKESFTDSVNAVLKGQGGTMGQVAEGLAMMGMGKSDKAKAVRASEKASHHKAATELAVAYGGYRKAVRSKAKNAPAMKQKARDRLKALAEEKGFELDLLMAQAKDPTGQKWSLTIGGKVS